MDQCLIFEPSSVTAIVTHLFDPNNHRYGLDFEEFEIEDKSGKPLKPLSVGHNELQRVGGGLARGVKRNGEGYLVNQKNGNVVSFFNHPEAEAVEVIYDPSDRIGKAIENSKIDQSPFVQRAQARFKALKDEE